MGKSLGTHCSSCVCSCQRRCRYATIASREWTQIQLLLEIQIQLEIQTEIQIELGELVSQSIFAVVFIKLRLIIYADFNQWGEAIQERYISV